MSQILPGRSNPGNARQDQLPSTGTALIGRADYPDGASLPSRRLDEQPQQPGGWPDPFWSTPSPTGSAQNYSTSGQPTGYPDPYQPGGYPAYGYPPAAAPSNGLAVASMVVSIVAAVGLVCYRLGGYVVGAVLGHVSRRQIRESGGNGDGMALAGIIRGWIAAGLAVVATVLIVVFVVLASTIRPSA